MFLLYLLVLLAAENLSNWPSPKISWQRSFISAEALSLTLVRVGRDGWNFLQGSLSGGGLKDEVNFLWAGGVSMLSESISTLSDFSILSGLATFTSRSLVTLISGSFRCSSVIDMSGCGDSICCRDRCLLSRLISSFSSVFLQGTLVSFFCGCTSGENIILINKTIKWLGCLNFC